MTIETYTLTPFMTNCFVLRDDGETVVVDPGEAAPELLEAIADTPVKLIVNTHCHIDHSGGNAGVKAATGAPLVLHEADVPLLRAIPQQGMMFGVQADPSPDPDAYLEEGDVLEVGSQKLAVRHTPGHAPGHIVLVGDGYVIAGDTLFAGSIGRTDLPGGNMDQLLASIRDKLLTLPDDTIVYNGHGPATTIGQERAANPFLQGL